MDKTSGDGSGLIVVALVVAFVVGLAGFNWVVEAITRAL